MKSHAAPGTEMAHGGIFKDVFREINKMLLIHWLLYENQPIFQFKQTK